MKKIQIKDDINAEENLRQDGVLLEVTQQMETVSRVPQEKEKFNSSHYCFHSCCFTHSRNLLVNLHTPLQDFLKTPLKNRKILNIPFI